MRALSSKARAAASSKPCGDGGDLLLAGYSLFVAPQCLLRAGTLCYPSHMELRRTCPQVLQSGGENPLSHCCIMEEKTHTLALSLSHPCMVSTPALPRGMWPYRVIPAPTFSHARFSCPLPCSGRWTAERRANPGPWYAYLPK